MADYDRQHSTASRDYYNRVFKGGLAQCARCGYHYNRRAKYIGRVGGRWLCIYCEDPED